MALLQSLQICGVRSFSPDTVETIYFNTPVTLFLGQNGSGKTTIIESIRFALTSELPAGSSNGQGFVNDPKISNKSSTKASVKIKFLDCQGHEITVSRFMLVSTKAGGGLTFKKLAVHVRKRDKDEPALNVSKSILNNVIFCHQENSAWPLDEPKKLKEKFDEIFDAVKYNKCVETFRKYIKEKQNNVKVLKERLSTKKLIKDEVERKRGRYNEKNDKLTEVNDRIKERETKLNPMDDRMEEILNLEVSISTLQRKLTGKETEKKGVIEQQDTIKEHISYVFEGSDEELANKMVSFQEEQEAEKTRIIELENRSKEINAKNDELKENMQKIQVKIGELKEEQKQHNQRIAENKTLLEKTASKLEITISPDSKEDKSIISDIKQALKASEKAFEDLVKQIDLEEKNLQNEIDNTREKYVKTKQMISSKNDLIEESQKKIKDINCKLEELDTSDSQLTIIADNIKKLQVTLTNLKNSFNENEKLSEIEEMKELIQEKENYLRKLERENRILQQNYATEQKIDREKSLVIEKQGEVNRIKTKHLQNLQELFGENVPEKNLRKSVTEIQNKADAKYKTITNTINELQKKVTTLETNIRHQKDKLESSRKELDTDKKKVEDLCLGRPFNEVLTENYNKKEKLQKDKGQYSSAKIMYEAFINKFERESPCCPICQTDFSEKKSIVKDIIQDLKKKIERIPLQLIQIEKDLKTTEENYNKLQQLKPVNDNIEMLTNAKIPLMEEELINLRTKYDTFSEQLRSERNNSTAPQNTIEVCKSMITDVTLLDQYMSDMEKSNNFLAELESTIVNVPSNRSRQETEAEIDSVNAELKNHRSQYDSNKTMVDSHRDRCQRLNNNIQTETQRQIEMQKLVQQKPLLEVQKEEYTEKLMVLKMEIQEHGDVLNNLKGDLAKVTEERQNTVMNNRKVKEEKQSEIMAVKNMIAEINKLQKQIDLYVKNNNNAKLEEAIAELADLKTKEKKLEDTKVAITEIISTKKQNLAKQQINFRALKDNETLREKQKLEMRLETEIVNLKKQIGDYNIKSIYEEKQRLQRKIESHHKEISTLKGQEEEMKKQLSEMESDLEKPDNKNAFNNYKKQYYELRVNEVAIKDLSNYVGVLERSVLQFHKERMVQINKIIRELWRNIYRGNDIDYIEIKTDECMTGGVNRRRTYNYKVVQIKKGVELEMRGRCSAGQKVLACLVIRMALAETFSAHCGILALDEPTTNLDRENILSLSDALSRIIATREKEKNFQLLIITHDEEFLNTLTRVQSLDCYWKVKRNEEGFSKLQKEFL
ncbi:DNA repair protein RAD50 isoform X2 [Anoplophora glabripennis]|uniref:DNA repair protein RAD50 isoform X2 n=1 Tax=Anoplophora glabripennis TaxID=217634 RepID=UPI000873AC7C|nr:DNA repair protein RAD50 isoform X2 [Anoplophora glabripennis]